MIAEGGKAVYGASAGGEARLDAAAARRDMILLECTNTIPRDRRG